MTRKAGLPLLAAVENVPRKIDGTDRVDFSPLMLYVLGRMAHECAATPGVPSLVRANLSFMLLMSVMSSGRDPNNQKQLEEFHALAISVFSTPIGKSLRSLGEVVVPQLNATYAAKDLLEGVLSHASSRNSCAHHALVEASRLALDEILAEESLDAVRDRLKALRDTMFEACGEGLGLEVDEDTIEMRDTILSRYREQAGMKEPGEQVH